MAVRPAETRPPGAAPQATRRARPRLLAGVGLLTMLGLAGAAALGAWRSDRAEHAAQASLQARIAAIQGAPATSRSEPCSRWRERQPLVLLALGQSNAGNHGGFVLAGPPVRVVHDGRCLWASDPLPGGTGSGGSVWSRLPQRLAARLPSHWRERPVVLAVLAVDATSLQDWVRSDSPLRARLAQTARMLVANGLVPQLVLWQQGEAEARADTPPAQVAARLDSAAAVLAEAGISAPWMLAQSTLCRSSPHASVRDAIQRRAADGQRFVSGPDTDQLAGPAMRRDGCHFSAAGLDAAADLWTAAMAAYFARH